MKNKISFSVFIIASLTWISSASAELPFYFSAYGTLTGYQNGSFGDFNQNFISRWKSKGFNPKVTNDFEYRPNWGFAFGYSQDLYLNPGIFLEKMSNLSSVGFRDYSGEFRTTTEISNYFSGVCFSNPLFIPDLKFSFQVGMLWGTVKTKEKFDIFLSTNPKSKFFPLESNGNFALFGMEPGFNYSKNIMSLVTCSVGFSYLITTSKTFKFQHHGDDLISSSQREEISINRTGLRVKIGISINANDLVNKF